MTNRCDTHNIDLESAQSCPRCVAEIKVREIAPAPQAMRCAGCNRILTRLPHTAVCINAQCARAGVLVPNAEAHGRAVARTVQPLFGQEFER
jgi:hypothetical protein